MKLQRIAGVLRCGLSRVSAAICAGLVTALLSACALLPAGRQAKLEAGEQPFELTLTLDKEVYDPGAPVIGEVTLKNLAVAFQKVATLDRLSLAFYFYPKRAGGSVAMRREDPVASRLESPVEPIELRPGESVIRRFAFTRLTLERGEYVVQCVYTTPSRDPDQPELKAYAKAVSYAVQGEKAFCHRTVDGLLTKEDAMALAARELNGEVKGTEAKLIVDEMGFLKWWVNVSLAAGGDATVTRAYLVDPYLAVARDEVRPFVPKTTEEEFPFPADSQKLYELRQRKWEVLPPPEGSGGGAGTGSGAPGGAAPGGARPGGGN